MKEQNRESENAVNLARDFRRIAASHAEFKRTEGYIEDNYSISDIFNLDASLEVCRRGPADYFYETALDLFSHTLGRYHQETLSLVHEIIDYHVNNVKRMMIERNVVTAVILLGPVLLMAKHMFPTSVPMRLLALYGSFFSLYAYSKLEEWLLCFLERRHYQQMYNK